MVNRNMSNPKMDGEGLGPSTSAFLRNLLVRAASYRLDNPSSKLLFLSLKGTKVNKVFSIVSEIRMKS